MSTQPDNQSAMSEQASKQKLEADICVHIFSVSAALVGVCLTVIGLLRVVISVAQAKLKLLSTIFGSRRNPLFFFPARSSYWALRTRSLYRMHRVERVADLIFLVGLFLMVLICSVVAYAIW